MPNIKRRISYNVLIYEKMKNFFLEKSTLIVLFGMSWCSVATNIHIHLIQNIFYEF